MFEDVVQTSTCKDNACDCGTFFLDCAGCFGHSQVHVESSPAVRQKHPNVERLIEETWRNEIVRAQEAGKTLFDGRLCRLNSASYRNSTLELSVGEVSFKEFLGTNLTHAYLRYVHGPEVLADALGASAVIRTGDGFLLLGMRSQSVLYHAGRIHPIGGIIEAAKDQPVDPFAAMKREIEQEINVSEFQDIHCLGLVRDKHIIQPELVFDVSIGLEFIDVRQLAEKALDAHEHSEWVPLRDHPAAAVNFIEQNYCRLTPLAMASLLLHGLRHWGSGWFAATRGYLRSVI